MLVAFDGRPMQGNARGMGVYASGLLAGLAEAGFADSILVVLDRALPAPFLPPAYGTRTSLAGGRGGTVAWEQRHLPRAAAKCSLLHCTANGAPLSCPVPVVITLHDAIFMRKWRDISDKAYLRQLAGHIYRTTVYPRAARRASAIVTVSEASRTAISSALGIPAGSITVAPEAPGPAFSASVPTPGADLRARFALEGPFLLALGGYERRKNVSTLIRMMGMAAPGLPPVLALAGAENIGATRYRDEASALGKPGAVRFLPYLDTGDLKGLYGTAEAFLWPSLSEGFGLPLLEAMQAGAPVIASDIPVNREVAGDAARYADPRDPGAWARAAAGLAGDPSEAARMRERGRQRLANFSWIAAARTVIEVYRRVAGVR